MVDEAITNIMMPRGDFTSTAVVMIKEIFMCKTNFGGWGISLRS